ncbi:MAG TPA: hypothetical protein VJY34_21940 [Roseiarcus sp.]|nr:hypothetical protein [Roseiarcus sp.]
MRRDNPRDWAHRLSDFAIELSSSEYGVVKRGQATDVLGGLIEALRHLLRELDSSAAADPLRPGEFVTMGTLTDAPSAAAGQTWSTKLRGIALEGLRLRFG